MRRQEKVLEGQVAVITGAAGALGRAAAVALGGAGASTLLAGRRRDGLEATADRVRRAGGRARAVPTDVTRVDDVDHLVRTALDEHGHIDLLVNLVGGLGPGGVPLWDTDPGEWQRTLTSNVTGLFLPCRAVLPHMIARGRGRIMNPASASATVPMGGLGTYCVTKAATQQLTHVLAAELEGSGVAAMEVWMGATTSPMSAEVRWVLGIQEPARRARDPFDAMAMLVVLALAEVEDTNGQTIGRDEPWVRAAIADLDLAVAR